MKSRLRRWIDTRPFPVYKLSVYIFSLVLIGVACSAIYWPCGLLVVGGLLWIDLFVTDLIVQLRMGRQDDVRSR